MVQGLPWVPDKIIGTLVESFKVAVIGAVGAFGELSDTRGLSDTYGST